MAWCWKQGRVFTSVRRNKSKTFNNTAESCESILEAE